MKKPILLLLTATLFHFLAPAFSVAQNFSDAEIKRWNKQAKNVTIIRDTWGIPHVYGKTDADCVFGIMYAQCEDDFRRVENGYIDMLGRSAEVKGKNNIYNDVYTRLVIDSAEAVEDYHNSPAWLKKLLHAFADGMNYFLYKNPHVKPALIQRFEPWYPLLWTDGSMGHINTAGVTVTEVRKFYSALESAGSGMSATGAGIFASGELDDDYAESSDGVMTDLLRDMHSGSNGFAIAPSKSESGNAMLFINPHVSFYYRPEVHVISKEGLNAYGALTWGQFFVYQGFNERLGWMHTSGYSDVADAYEEEVVKKGDSLYYLYEGSLRPVKKKIFRIKYKEGNEIKEQEVTGYFTHHGPVMANRNGKWISVKALNRNINGLLQSWLRTKARNFAEFKQTMEFKANPTNNTMYADSDGNISYWHGNVIPKRDTSFNWLLPVDGTIAATEWKGMHALDEIVQVHNPSNGWIQNCNSTPFAAAGANSPRKEDYPFYMATEAENFRGINALRILNASQQFNLDKLIELGYDTYLAAFEVLIPSLLKAWENKKDDENYSGLKDAIEILRNWDLRCSETSVATTLAIEWGENLIPKMNTAERDVIKRMTDYVMGAKDTELLGELKKVLNKLQSNFGTWYVAWGEVNRYQRTSGEPGAKYEDSKASLPVAFAASTWGCLPSYVSRYYDGTKKRYGYNGNTFICAVEFGKKLKAKSLLTGGVSGDPNSPHFTDQAELYSKGKFKDVLFYKEDILKNAVRKYKPGQ